VALAEEWIMRAELYRIERVDPGALSIMARPRGGDWLAEEIQAWQEAGVDVIVSLLTPTEQTELGLDEEAWLCAQHQLAFWPFPIPDRALPSENAEADRLVEEIVAALYAGKHVAVHCRMGIGRSAMLAAAALVTLGDTVQQAFDRIETARGLPVPDTQEQRRWVQQYAARRQGAESSSLPFEDTPLAFSAS
jgi:protein-tyrosine phosphatase